MAKKAAAAQPGFHIPSPFAIAVLLTFLSIALAYFLSPGSDTGTSFNVYEVLLFWEKGFWELLSFSMQMCLILLLGHVLALTPLVRRLIDWCVIYCSDTARAAVIVSASAILMSFVNWGLGLVFGAIFVRKIGEYCQREKILVNYPLLGAAGYAGLMTWHGGLSGSAPLIVAQQGHFLEDQIGVLSIEQTIFSSMNIVTSALLLLLIPGFFFWYGKQHAPTFIPSLKIQNPEPDKMKKGSISVLDYKKWPGILLGSIIILLCLYKPFTAEFLGRLSFINLNYINFLLFGGCLILHGSLFRFVQAVETGISDIAGIVIQFPLYAGIMGVMKYSGLIVVFSNAFVSVSDAVTFPVFTFVSAGIVNAFVPSGGGQWAVQGPIIVEAAKSMNVNMGKAVMALAYGDQITNMLQPFWALPLLGITRLTAGQLLPHTLKLFGLGTLLFVTVLLVF
jgi:short-chain fatty acids transporter